MVTRLHASAAEITIYVLPAFDALGILLSSVIQEGFVVGPQINLPSD